MLADFLREVGIVGYGAYVPAKRISSETIVRAREAKRKDLPEFLEKIRDGLLLRYKAVAGFDEDSTTMATEAALNAIEMAGIEPSAIKSVAVGSESKPYAVGTIARHVASFVGIGNDVYIADLEGACNAGMQAVSFIEGQIKSGRIDYGLAIGTDVAQAPAADPLEYACGAGAAAFVLGRRDLAATIVDTASYSSLTMDFWRRDGAPVPSHFGKTTVEAYITHVVGAIEGLLGKNPELRLRDFDYVTFHQPSGYMPLKTCKVLANDPGQVVRDEGLAGRMRIDGQFIEERVKPWLRVLDIGNTYAASTPIAICDILDHAKPGQDILAVSYGSGAYALATWLRVEDAIEAKRGTVPTVRDYIKRAVEIKLETYQDIIRYKIKNLRRRITRRRIIGEVEPLGDKRLGVTLCDGCKRVYYPARDKCLEHDCPGPVEQRALPALGILKSFKKLPLRKRFKSNYYVIKGGKALVVDSELEGLWPGMEVEAVIRMVIDEGRKGLLLYAPCYRPLFRARPRPSERTTVPQSLQYLASSTS